MNEITKAIAAKEEITGRKLSPQERLNLCRSMPSKDDNKERLEIALTQTLPGIEATNTFHERLEIAKMSSGVGEKHKVSIWWESTKRDLLKRFNAGELKRIKV